MAGPGSEMMGEVFSDALPAEDPVLYGYAEIDPAGRFQARSHQTFRITYTTGRYGLDDTGSIKILLRFTADGGDLQMDDPVAANYVTAKSSNGVPLKLSFHSNGHVRPWYQALSIFVHKGYLSEGDSIEIIIGDRSAGSPGYRLQSMCESAFTWRVVTDVCATGHFVPIAQSPTIAIDPGPPSLWKVIVPTLRRPGEAFRLGIKAEDLYGNPSDQIDARLKLSASGATNHLPETIHFAAGKRSLIIEGLSIDAAGSYTFSIQDQAGQQLATSNPIVIAAGAIASWWGDMHGQSGESVGINTAREYFSFARDLAFLDATSHQANDFQINNAFWDHINELTAEFHRDHHFLTLPGYEWSGNTGVGGDRNVYFRNEGRPIRRSSHALIADRRNISSDAPTASALFEALQDEDCVVYAHIGGRPADVAYAHDARLETAMEIHSAWGTFEWLMADCFEQGFRVGVVANSDGHKGRPGASYPGTSQFGAYGGLTCFLMDELSRDAWFECLRQRRHYATTGDRIHIELSVTAEAPLYRHERDPLVHANEPEAVAILGMGDIARTESGSVQLSFRVHSAAPIERVDVLNAMETIATIRNPASSQDSRRIRILWRGAMVRGRGARADWSGEATFEGCKIRQTREINAWNADRRLQQLGDHVLRWNSVTAGNFGAFDVWLEQDERDGVIHLETNHVSASLELTDIGAQDSILDAGGLDLEIRLFRLAEHMKPGPLEGKVSLPLAMDRDNPLWIRVTTEDGFQAWTSPVYLVNQ